MNSERLGLKDKNVRVEVLIVRAYLILGRKHVLAVKDKA